MKRFFGKGLISLSLIILFLTSCSSHRFQEDSNSLLREEVLSQALNWIITHPATFEDGGFLEMGEEINLFYVLYTKTESESEKKIYRDRITRIIEDLRTQEHFTLKMPGDVSAYLVITKVADRLGYNTTDFHDFINQKILQNPMAYPPNITYIILNSSILVDLGYKPMFPIKVSIKRGLIANMAQNRFLVPIGQNFIPPQVITNFFYDITHEIFAISGFGDRKPKRIFTPKEIDFIHYILEEGVSLYLPKEELDILCELIVCAKIMNYTTFPGYQEAINFILSTQKEDGTFGLIPRMKDLGRINLYRHGVLVAVWALAS